MYFRSRPVPPPRWGKRVFERDLSLSPFPCAYGGQVGLSPRRRRGRSRRRLYPLFLSASPPPLLTLRTLFFHSISSPTIRYVHDYTHHYTPPSSSHQPVYPPSLSYCWWFCRFSPLPFFLLFLLSAYSPTSLLPLPLTGGGWGFSLVRAAFFFSSLPIRRSVNTFFRGEGLRVPYVRRRNAFPPLPVAEIVNSFPEKIFSGRDLPSMGANALGGKFLL